MLGTEAPERDLSEDYWQALLSQGEDAPDIVDGASGSAGAGANGQAEGLPAKPTRPRDAAQWAVLNVWMAQRRLFAAPVIGCNKGGLLVRVCEGLGFVPASQLVDLPHSLGTPELRGDLEAMVGRELRLRLIEVDPERERVICSERATQWQSDDLDQQLADLSERVGSEVEGVVRSVCDFGAFVDLGGVDGLVHISELSWQRVRHPEDIVQPEQPIRVRVLNVDFVHRRVGLSLKRLHPDPWQLVAERHQVGDVIPATVTNIVPFGAFARVEEGIEGLIHISELAEASFTDPREVVTEGQEVRVRVLHIDPASRRLGLSIRQA